MARVQLEYPNEIFTFSTELDVRFDDINIGAHLGFDKLVTLVTEARSRYLESLDIAEVASPGMIVTDLAVTYRAEARLRDHRHATSTPAQHDSPYPILTNHQP